MVLDNTNFRARLGRKVGRIGQVSQLNKGNQMNKEDNDIVEEKYLVKETYSPEKAYPQLRNATWRELEKPGKVKILTREEIEELYDVRTCAPKSVPQEG